MYNLRNNAIRSSTAKNYLSIWRAFNKFLFRLDRKPQTWEEKTALYCTHLIENGSQSSTIRSYVSAIKNTLKCDGYVWSDDKILLEALIKACKLKNDHVSCRFPIKIRLLETLLFEVERTYLKKGQLYLEKLYKAIFALAYYGLMCIGELTEGEHTIKVRDIHIGDNKNKILIVLHSSKTHGVNKQPQIIKISALEHYAEMQKKWFFCPFTILREFLLFRGGFEEDWENFFVFADGSVVKPSHVRTVLWALLRNLSLDPTLYNTHSFRSGRSSDLLHFGKTLSEIKLAGRWQSNIVFWYLKF